MRSRLRTLACLSVVAPVLLLGGIAMAKTSFFKGSGSSSPLFNLSGSSDPVINWSGDRFGDAELAAVAWLAQHPN